MMPLAFTHKSCYNVLRKGLIHMPHVSLRVTDEEKNLMESYAKLLGLSLSEAIKAAFFEKLEDEYDLQSVREHEAEKAQGVVAYYTHAEVKELLGLG